MPSETLPERIAARILREGPLSFAEYMRMALYEPGYGYYVTSSARIGWEGDYFTSSDVGDFFARCLGRQLYQMWEELRRPQSFLVLEQGAGRANLAASVQAWAASAQPDFAQALCYQSQDLNTGQDAVAPALDSELAPSVIFSNELLDAFPVHVVEKRGELLSEVYVTLSAGRLREILAAPSSTDVATYLDTYHIPWRNFPDGWRAEINLDALRWVRQSAQRLRQGFLLTIDYGARARQLYTRARRRGTLACYYQHQLNERPLARPGEQDITAHVNFSALIAEGRQQGLRLRSLTTQGAWLQQNGILVDLEGRRTTQFAVADSARASDQGQVALLRWYNLRQRVLALTDPHGLGAFKVLILRRPPSNSQKTSSH